MNESGMSDDDKRSIYYVLGTVDDLVGDFLYYGRKEDEDLPRGEIERLIGKGSLTVDEIVERFRSALVSELPATDKTEAS